MASMWFFIILPWVLNRVSEARSGYRGLCKSGPSSGRPGAWRTGPSGHRRTGRYYIGAGCGGAGLPQHVLAGEECAVKVVACHPHSTGQKGGIDYLAFAGALPGKQGKGDGTGHADGSSQVSHSAVEVGRWAAGLAHEGQEPASGPEAYLVEGGLVLVWALRAESGEETVDEPGLRAVMVSGVISRWSRAWGRTFVTKTSAVCTRR